MCIGDGGVGSESNGSIKVVYAPSDCGLICTEVLVILFFCLSLGWEAVGCGQFGMIDLDVIVVV